MLFRKAENKRKAMVIRRRLPMHFERNISSRQVGDDDSVGVGDAARVHEKERERAIARLLRCNNGRLSEINVYRCVCVWVCVQGNANNSIHLVNMVDTRSTAASLPPPADILRAHLMFLMGIPFMCVCLHSLNGSPRYNERIQDEQSLNRFFFFLSLLMMSTNDERKIITTTL